MVGTVLGGPLAPAILLIINYQNSNRKGNIKKALLLVGLLNVLVFGSLFAPVDSFVYNIPNAVYGAFVLSAIYAIIVFYLSNDLQTHAKEGGTFYSAWGAAGIAIAGSALILGANYYYVNQMTFDSQAYTTAMNEFSENEQKAFEVYDLLERGQYIEAGIFIEDEGIQLWKSNIHITDSIASIEDLPENYLEYNNLLKEYCSLRITSLEAIDEYLTYQIDEAKRRVDLLHSEIDDIVQRISEFSR